MDTVVAGMVSGVANSVGQQSDAASATGSVNAKIADVKNAITNKNNPVDWSTKKPRGADYPMTTIGSSTSVTILNISGSGYLNSVIMNANAGQAGLGVYVDGTKISDENNSKVTATGYVTVTGMTGLYRFNTSLQVIVRATTANTPNISASIGYVLD